MAIRKILTQEDETLHAICKPVEKFDEKLAQLLDDMHETLDKAQGVGLAAPQIGIRRRIFIMHVDDEKIEAINPQIIKTKGRQRVLEGCLSCPGEWGYTIRPISVKFKAQNRNGEWYEKEVSDLFAQAVCHELEHLDGHIFTEKVVEFVEVKE